MAGTKKTFAGFSGNSELAGGIAPGIPVANLESIPSATVINNISVVDGIMPSKSQTIFLEPRIFGDRFDWISRGSMPYGAFTELAMFKNSPASKKRTGLCISYGDAQMFGQQLVTNWAYNISITLKDREINRGVMSEAEATAYYAAKMRMPLQTMALERFARWKQLFASVIDGTRTIAGTTSSDGTGDVTSYAVTVGGYAGKVDKITQVIPTLTPGVAVEFDAATGDADVLEILNSFKNAKTWADYPSNEYAKGLTAADEMVIGGTFNLIMETAILDAMDSMWTMSPTYKGISKSARDYIREFLGAGRLVEIDVWPELPTNVTYADHRLLGVLIDSEAPREFVEWEDVAADYCMQERYTSYNYQGSGASGIFKGLPSYALVCKTK